MASRNGSAFSRVELTGRDLLDYVVGLVLGVLVWVVESYGSTSTLVFDPTWTAVGVACGLALFAVSTFSTVGRRIQLAFRERTPVSLATFLVAFLLGLWLLFQIDVTFRPVHYSWFLGLGLSQLVGIGLYLWQRTSG